MVKEVYEHTNIFGQKSYRVRDSSEPIIAGIVDLILHPWMLLIYIVVGVLGAIGDSGSGPAVSSREMPLGSPQAPDQQPVREREPEPRDYSKCTRFNDQWICP